MQELQQIPRSPIGCNSRCLQLVGLQSLQHPASSLQPLLGFIYSGTGFDWRRCRRSWPAHLRMQGRSAGFLCETPFRRGLPGNGMECGMEGAR